MRFGVLRCPVLRHFPLAALIWTLAACGAAPAWAQPAAAAPGKSSTQAIRQYRDSTTFQNRGLYDLAADEWEKFLEKFPDDPLASKALHYLGVCRLQLKQYDAAEVAFKKVIAKYPNFELLDTTYLDLGLTQFSQAQAGKPELYAASAASLRTLTERFPESKQLPQALFYLGESLYAADKKPEAAEAYSKALAKNPDAAVKADALNALGITRQELGKYAEAGAAFDQFIKEFASHPLRTDVIVHRAETLLALGQHADAEKWFASARASKDYAAADYATLREAECLALQKKYAEAAALDASLVEKYPQSNYLAEAALNAGKYYFLANKFAEAEPWLNKAAAAGGAAAPEAAHWLAKAYLKQKRPADAERSATQAQATAGKSPFALDLQLDRADAIYEAGRAKEAVPLYAAIASENRDSPAARSALYMAAFASLGLGDYGAASGYADTFLKNYASDALAPDVKYVAAEAKLLSGDYPAAERLYSELLASAGGHAQVNAWKLRRATAMLLAKKYREVITTLSPDLPAFKAPELSAEALYLLGSAHLELGEADAAVKDAQASLAAAPQGKQADEALLVLAAAYRRLQNLPEAIAAARRVVSHFPQSKSLDRAQYRLGEYSYATGEFPAAAAAYQAVLDHFPSSAFAPYSLYGLGWSRIETGDFAAAEGNFSQLIDKHSGHAFVPQALSGRARARQSLKKYGEAIADVDAFLKSNPSGAEKSDALFVKGLSEVGLQKRGDAVNTFRVILDQDPGYAAADQVLYEMAWALMDQKQESAAADAFAKLAKDYPKSRFAAEAAFLVGEDRYASKRFSEAAELFYSAMTKGGKTEVGQKAAYRLAMAYYQQGQFDKAQQSFEFVVGAFPQSDESAECQFMAAECLFKQNKYDAAWEAYQRAIAHPPANKEHQLVALLHAGQAAMQIKKWNDATKLLERAIGDFPDAPKTMEAVYELASCRQNQGNEAAAIKLFDQASAADGEVGARARFMLGEIYFGKKDFKEAVRQYMKVAYGYGYPNASDAVKKWQANSAYEAGRCFENLRQLDQAKKSYREVVDQYPQSPRAADARGRLAELGS
jgi:TolA-binding protein